MKYEWMDAYCLMMRGVTKDYKEEWQAERFLLCDKMFVMVGGDKEGKPIVTVKLEPQNGQALRAQYPDIIPGYYMNKVHWNSVYKDGNVPDDLMKQMIDESYRLVLSGLPKKLQKEIQQER